MTALLLKFDYINLLDETRAAGGNKGAIAENPGQAVLEFSSWRTEDIERMDRVHALFMKTHPGMFIGGSWELGLFEDLGLDPKTKGSIGVHRVDIGTGVREGDYGGERSAAAP